ncbi:hypothetical protein BU17DRAFT_96474 [Hysterangium stoloniferum]|nr:hypothetical protein BU17DRAFT_96474 [Hysterangium stoloniferum]
MSSGRAKNVRPPSVRGARIACGIPRMLDSASGGGIAPVIPDGTELTTVEETPVAGTFNSVESLFSAMRDAIVRTNNDKRCRNRARAALRAEGKSDVDADEVLEAVPSEGILRSMVTPTPGNRATCVETGWDPPQGDVGSVIDKPDAGPLGVTEEGGVGADGDVHSTSALPAGLTAPLLTAINKGGPGTHFPLVYQQAILVLQQHGCSDKGLQPSIGHTYF